MADAFLCKGCGWEPEKVAHRHILDHEKGRKWIAERKNKLWSTSEMPTVG